ncbi:MAG: hypothetical protein A3J08_01700 [Candidatus Lloydbacteria bacterium RIFCSPLOWO2_02_FULL_51_11]|uniref:Uncharacterized protein n=1 Tax=Candidatus Lloydbacteria bacterium RIFCSPLOWO2_02_FULL_51_11 TaxID=1798667 RepID=A0A1G2DNS4_9BACT|nr:MAG: hypothetical protein A3J08_01700 [Candidatus Lloydbacteria bacterium RIFCSPLOWO2_02_FULL_51_11]
MQKPICNDDKPYRDDRQNSKPSCAIDECNDCFHANPYDMRFLAFVNAQGSNLNQKTFPKKEDFLMWTEGESNP